MWFRLLQVLMLLVFSSLALADENTAAKKEKEEKDTAKLQEVVVTATRTEKEAAEAPGKVNVVTQKEIEKSPALTIDGVLSTVPGLFERRANLMDTAQSITLGGIPGQNRTLILKDGVPLNNAYTGDVVLTAMPLGDIRQIEVVQGPFSSLYGGNAMGGVVNIMTKMPEKREFTAQGGYGTSWNRGESLNDLQTYYLSYGDKPTDKLRMLLSYGYKATNGYAKDQVVISSQPPAGTTGWSRTTSNTGATRYLIGDKGDNTWWDDSLDVKLGYDFSSSSKVSASVQRMRYRYNYDEPHTYLTNAAGRPVYSYGTVNESSFCSGSGYTETAIYALNFENDIGPARIKLTLALNDQGENWYTTPNTSPPYATLSGLNGKVSSTPNKNYYADFQATFPLFSRNILTVGGSFRAGRSNTEENNLVYYKDETSTTSLTYTSGGKDTNYAFFAQDEILLHEKLTAYIGFREDWWRTYDGYANQFGTGAFSNTYDARTDSSFSPKASLVFRPFEATTLRSSVGQAFRAPTNYELYRTWVSTTGVTYQGNPNLVPETTTTWDIGVSQGLWKGAAVSATYFDNYLKNLIYRKSVTPTLQEYINAGKAESKGVILSAEQKIDNWLRFFTNFTYTDAKIKENAANPLTVGKRLTYLPEYMFNVGAYLELRRFSLSVIGRYVSKLYTNDQNLDVVDHVYGSYDPFFTADAKVACKISKYVTASFSVLNIADEKYYQSYLAPGRMWLGELELRI